MRHEKIILVVLAYVIGFVTAYIGFELTPDFDHKKPYGIKAGRAEQTPTQTSANAATSSDTVEVVFNENGMFARVDGYEVIISGKLRDNMEPGPGFHVDIPDYAVSPNGAYIYYCEQQRVDTEHCNDYVYVVDEHVTKPLKYNGSGLTSSLIQSEFQWQHDSTITYNGYRSRSAQSPWQLIDGN